MGKCTYEDVKQYIESLGYKLVSEYYNNNHQQLIIIDTSGYYYTTILGRLKRGIIPDKFNKSNLYTVQNIKLWCKLNNKSFELISEIYDGAGQKLKWKCLKEDCGEEFESSWCSIYSMKVGCSYCSGRQAGISNCLAAKNPELAKEWHPTKNGDLTPYDVTEFSNKKVWWQCSKNPKHEWNIAVAHRTNSRNCPYCLGRYASEEYNLLIINPELCEEWDYTKNKNKPEEYTPGSNEKVWWKCKECNHEWEAEINNRNGINKTGCPECNNSKGEKRCKEIFINNKFKEVDQEHYYKLSKTDKYNNIYFIQQKTFDGLFGINNGLLSYDFYLPQYNLLIEYQGEYHDNDGGNGRSFIEKQYKKQQEHDKRKRKYAENNNIKVLEIWYWEFDNIEEILLKELNL